MKVEIDGGEASQVVAIDNNSCYVPQISPDGKYLAYTCFDNSNYQSNLQIVGFEGNVVGSTVKTMEYNFINSFIWTPDGKSLTYLNAHGSPNLWKLPVDGSSPQPITEFTSGRIFRYRWSNDGKHLLFVRGIVNSDLVLIKDANIRNTP